jgi:heterotetrameric sarcosine oxidase delta subunit
MLLIPCPHCGPRSHIEFTYAGDATVRRPPDDAPLAAWVDYVYVRDNPRGPHREFWQHTQGCRAYVTVERDTATHAIARTQPAGDAGP